MAKIRDSKPKSSSGNYARLFGDEDLGALITKIQSTVISTGSALEKAILSRCKKGCIIKDCDNFFNNYSDDKVFVLGYRIFLKKDLKKSKVLDLPKKSEPDFVVLKMDKHKKHCYIVELKLGYMFDTKKTKGERELIRKFEDRIAKRIQYTTQFYICAFFEKDKEKIRDGLKHDFELDEIMTGEDFCRLLEIDYQEIIEETYSPNAAADNIDYFIEELVRIPKVRALLSKKLRN
jgi:hypothetical protein